MKTFITGLIIVLVLGISAWYFLARQNNPSPSSTTPSETVSSDMPQTTQPAGDSQLLDLLRAGGSSYLDPEGVYTILYPSEYVIDSPADGHTRIYKQGATQTGQTEIYDGVIINIESIHLDGQSLSEWVDSQIKNATSDGTSEVVTPKTQTTQNSYTGYTYEMRSLGTFEYLVLQKDSSSDFAVSITTLVADPESVGYQKEVDATLSTLELLK